MKSKIASENYENGFKLFWDWFKKTCYIGRVRFNLWAYFFIGVIFFGGSGFWLQFFKSYLYSNQPDHLIALCSLSPAIAVSSCLDFIFGEDERKYLRGFGLFFGVLSIFLTAIAFFLINYLFASIATVISLFLWWLANAENPKLTDVIKPLDSVGGNTDEKVQGSMEGLSL